MGIGFVGYIARREKLYMAPSLPILKRKFQKLSVELRVLPPFASSGMALAIKEITINASAHRM
jgi:hypothetical protein